MHELKWYVLPLNPEPWAVGPLSVGRGRGGQYYPKMGANQQLVSYQNAVRSELQRQRAEMVELGEGYYAYELAFVFHQVLTKYVTPKGRNSQQKPGDLTNLVKATEDAIQGILIDNDTHVEKITSHVSRSEDEKAVPYVLIGAGPYLGINPNDIPREVWEGVDLAVAEHRRMVTGGREIMTMQALEGTDDVF